MFDEHLWKVADESAMERYLDEEVMDLEHYIEEIGTNADVIYATAQEINELNNNASQCLLDAYGLMLDALCCLSGQLDTIKGGK